VNARGQALSIAVHGWDLRSSSWQVLLSPRRARKCTREVSGGSASGESEDEGTADERERERERGRDGKKKIERKRSYSPTGVARMAAAVDFSPGVIYTPRRGVDI